MGGNVNISRVAHLEEPRQTDSEGIRRNQRLSASLNLAS